MTFELLVMIDAIGRIAFPTELPRFDVEDEEIMGLLFEEWVELTDSNSDRWAMDSGYYVATFYVEDQHDEHAELELKRLVKTRPQ